MLDTFAVESKQEMVDEGHCTLLEMPLVEIDTSITRPICVVVAQGYSRMQVAQIRMGLSGHPISDDALLDDPTAHDTATASNGTDHKAF